MQKNPRSKKDPKTIDFINVCFSIIVKEKELSLCQLKIKYIWSNNQSLKYQRFTLSGCKDIGI